MSKEIPTLKLGKPVGRVPIYFTDNGFTALRSVQRHFQDEVKERTGDVVNIPYSTTIHMALNKLCELEGIEIASGKESPD